MATANQLFSLRTIFHAEHIRMYSLQFAEIFRDSGNM